MLHASWGPLATELLSRCLQCLIDNNPTPVSSGEVVHWAWTFHSLLLLFFAPDGFKLLQPFSHNHSPPLYKPPCIASDPYISTPVTLYLLSLQPPSVSYYSFKRHRLSWLLLLPLQCLAFIIHNPPPMVCFDSFIKFVHPQPPAVYDLKLNFLQAIIFQWYGGKQHRLSSFNHISSTCWSLPKLGYKFILIKIWSYLGEFSGMKQCFLLMKQCIGGGHDWSRVLTDV